MNSEYNIKCLTFNDYQENTYIISKQSQCMVIDPGCSTPEERQIIQRELEPYSVVRLINTHAHLDHVFGLSWLANEYQLTPHIHKEESLIYQYQNVYAKGEGYSLDELPKTLEYWHGDMDHFTFGGDNWQVLWTPGHSPGHVCYYLPSENLCFTGDLLFYQGVGRSDLPMGDPKALIRSLKRLFQLPPRTQILPGHGPNSTLGAESAYHEL